MKKSSGACRRSSREIKVQSFKNLLFFDHILRTFLNTRWVNNNESNNDGIVVFLNFSYL